MPNGLAKDIIGNRYVQTIASAVPYAFTPIITPVGAAALSSGIGTFMDVYGNDIPVGEAVAWNAIPNVGGLRGLVAPIKNVVQPVFKNLMKQTGKEFAVNSGQDMVYPDTLNAGEAKLIK